MRPSPARHRAMLPALATAALLAVVVGACSDDDEAPPTTERATVELSGASLCDDPSGDAEGRIDLRSVGMVVRDGELVVTWAFDRPAVEPTTWSVLALPYQIGVEDPGGDGVAGGFVVDLESGERTDLGDAEVEGDQVQVAVPVADLDGITEPWTATVTVGGVETDACAGTPLPGR